MRVQEEMDMKTEKSEIGSHGIKRPDGPEKNQLPARWLITASERMPAPLMNTRFGPRTTTHHLFLKTLGVLFVLFLLAPAVLAAGPKPITDFSVNVNSGTAPLTVSFTDLSLNNPSGWAWYFGDETFTAPWTEVKGADWSGRYAHSSVAMPDGSIVLMGGNDGSLKNDVWRSTDNGTTWIEVNASAGWTPR